MSPEGLLWALPCSPLTEDEKAAETIQLVAKEVWAHTGTLGLSELQRPQSTDGDVLKQAQSPAAVPAPVTPMDYTCHSSVHGTSRQEH